MYSILQIAHQLENKFGKPFAQQARSNMASTVNPKVIHRLGAAAPKKSLVENYMIEIARNYKVDYTPDSTMFLVSTYTSLPIIVLRTIAVCTFGVCTLYVCILF